ncbi:peptide-methionine (S)-S-oxide reductase [Alteromonadaceae bacterium M269]|nr:peptide-methionine (S)-S-oxide reductase [Alteromonadaceae bacterium M269]
MKNHFFSAALLAASLLFINSQAMAAKTVLAGGCFWCIEANFEKLEGVSDVVSGFSGGKIKNPTYRGNHRGHYEVVEITYDPNIVSYEEILDYFWHGIDPFDPLGQFCDKGPSYRSAIFVANEEERAIAEASKQRVVEMFPDKKVVTPILDASTFYPVKGEESYHQDFYKKNPIRYYSYRSGCGRDRRTKQIWGDKAVH